MGMWVVWVEMFVCCWVFILCKNKTFASILTEDVVHQTVESVADRREDTFVAGGATAAGLGCGCGQLRTILRLGRLDRPVVGTIVASDVPKAPERRTIAQLNTRRSLSLASGRTPNSVVLPGDGNDGA